MRRGASRMMESSNRLLKEFLHTRRSFANAETMQNDLSLFTLWHNMRALLSNRNSCHCGLAPAALEWVEFSRRRSRGSIG